MVQKEDKSKKGFCPKRASLFVALFTGVVCVLCAAAIGAVVYRLHSSPLDMAFAKDYIEKSLSDTEKGAHVKIDTIMLHWPDLTGPILLGMQGIEVKDKEGAQIISLDGVALSFSRGHILRGQISPKMLIIKQPSLKIIRGVDGELDIGLGGGKGISSERETRADQTDIAATILEYIAQPGKQPRSQSPLAALEALRIQNAKLQVQDEILQKSWSLPRADIELRSTRRGLVSELYIDLVDENALKAYIDTEIVFDWKTHGLSVKGEIRNFNMDLITSKFPDMVELAQKKIVFDADFQAELDSSFMPSSVGLDFTGIDGDVKGINISVRSDLQKEEGKLSGPIKIAIDQIRQSQIAPLWMSAIDADNLREWLVDRFSVGLFKNLTADMQLIALKEEDGWSVDAQNIKAEWDFEDMSIDYSAPLDVVTAASGHGIFDNDAETLDVNIAGAQVAGLTIKSGRVQMIDIIEEGKAKAEIDVVVAGGLVDAFKYMAQEPIGFTHQFDMEKIKGQVDMAVNLKFPAAGEIMKEDIVINISGTVDQLTLPDVVQDMDVTGGPYAVTVDAEGNVNIKGSGLFEGRAMQAEYKTFLDSEGKPYDSQILASMTADQALREYMQIDLSEFLDGPVDVDLVYTEYKSGDSDARIKANLTPARVFALPFAYEKPAGQEGRAMVKAQLKQGVLQSVDILEGSAPNMTLKNAHLDFRQQGEVTQLAGGTVEHFTIDKTMAGLEFKVEPSGKTHITFNGQTLDLKPFMEAEEAGPEGYRAPPMIITANAGVMISANGENIKKGKVYLDIDGDGHFNQFEMDGVAGQGAVYLRYKPDEQGKRVFRLEADDAGATMKAFGLYDQMVGGKMVIYAEPVDGVFDRNVRGKAEITDFKVVGAPGLARLVGAMSLTGLVSSLSGEGLKFSKLESDFDWDYSPKGSVLKLKEGRTSGNSLGLTFDGAFDQRAKVMDVSGTIVPLSGINNLVGSIPVIGDILGGDGGLFAATYTMKGEFKEPKVSINPLSVLAPGIIRKVLFE